MLPPICTSRPVSRRIWAISAVVVDLPLVPVIAMKGASGASFARSRQNSSISPMISTPAACAFVTLQCGTGWVSGTPGESISAAKPAKSASRRSVTGTPCARTASTRSALSSKACTRAPPAINARAVASPDPPRPNRATSRPAKTVEGVMPISSSQLERRQPDHRKHDGDDPEADHDLRLGPAQLLEMVMDRRHLEHALARQLVGGDLDDHRGSLEHEQAADDGEHDFVLRCHCDCAEHAAERQRTGIAHEDLCGR